MGILRVFFALCVIAFHCGSSYLLSPELAVECFFVISGFYMSLILNEKYINPSDNLLFIKKDLSNYYHLTIFIQLLLW